MSENIFNNFSTNYRQVINKAIKLAVDLNTTKINPEILLYALTLAKGSLGAQIFSKANLKNDFCRKFISQDKGRPTTLELPEFDQTTLKIIEKSIIIAYRHQHSYVATEHLVLALVDSNSPKLQTIFKKAKINLTLIKKQIDLIFNSTDKFQNLNADYYSPADALATEHFPSSLNKNSILDTFAVNLTDANKQKSIDPLIGREEEISRLIEILMRRTKNNPLLLGEPGVGKTAIVEGLAKKIIEGQVPQILLNKKILALDIALIIAGTMFRGEFENRLKIILEEIKKDPNIIIFIDEIHNIIGAGSTQGSLDIANILKPALARGEIRCIGATTYEEFKKNLANDAALIRRFQTIKITEPTEEEALDILQGVKKNYEQYHQVTISDKALTSAIELSNKFITDRAFPDKAIDLIDEAAAKTKINQAQHPLYAQINKLQETIAKIKDDKNKAIINENFKQAILLKNQEKDCREQLEQRLTDLKNQKINLPLVDRETICQIVAKITGLPVAELLLAEKNKFLNLEKLLAKRIIGQNHILNAIACAIRRAKVGISEQNKPLATFMFLGASGTGKTYTAKVLNDLLYNHKKNTLIKIDMSEYAEKFNISKLIGAPAGYVGYKESGQLTDAVQKNPNSIILFDEIEKAHPDIFNLLLQILDEGYLTDAIGKKIDFRNTIIIMTSNIGTDKINKNLGFDNNSALQDDNLLKTEVKKFFRPEFINRIDKILIFNCLQERDLVKIGKLEIENLKQRLNKQNISVQINSNIIPYLFKSNYPENLGARFLKQNIEELIANPLAEYILKNSDKSTQLKVNVVNHQLIICHG